MNHKVFLDIEDMDREEIGDFPREEIRNFPRKGTGDFSWEETEDFSKDGRSSRGRGDGFSQRGAFHASGRRKRRRRRGIFLPVFLCIIALAALTGCLILVVKNRLLKTERNEAMAHLDAANASPTYSEAQVQDMIDTAATDAARQKEEEILGEVKGMMESGEGASAMLRALYPDEIVVAANSRYYFFPILDTLKHHSYIKEQFILNEDNILEYVMDGEVVSKKGIDVSRYQEKIDWEKVAGDGVDYAFIRLGIRGATEGKLILDERYEDNMEGALENGIRTGVYFFTQALNKEEAVEEAEFVLENLKGYDISYPIVLDVEEVTTKNPRTKDMEKQDWTDVCIAFCERIKEAGYTPMIYGNLKTFLLMLDMEQLEAYEKWFAYYQTPLYFPYEFSIWQYTSTGKVAGIGTDVDLNISMKDYGSEE